MKKINHWLYRAKWKAAPYINFKTPVHVDLELTTNCNLNCDFCYRQSTNIISKEMDFKVMKNVFSQLRNSFKIKSIKFNWRGEAINARNFYFAVGWVLDLPYKVSMEINTSLSRIITDREYLFDELAVFDKVKVSIDSMNPEIYKRIRKGGDLKRTIYNLQRLQVQRGYREKVIISRRTTNYTEPDLEFIEKLKNKIISEVAFDIRPADPRNKKDIYKINTEVIRKYCGQPSRRLVIGADGKAWACCSAHEEPQDLYLGNANEQSLKEIWDGSKRKALVKSLKKGDLPEACKNCTNQDARR